MPEESSIMNRLLSAMYIVPWGKMSSTSTAIMDAESHPSGGFRGCVNKGKCGQAKRFLYNSNRDKYAAFVPESPGDDRPARFRVPGHLEVSDSA
jgi:hypothetical protein